MNEWDSRPFVKRFKTSARTFDQCPNRWSRCQHRAWGEAKRSPRNPPPKIFRARGAGDRGRDYENRNDVQRLPNLAPAFGYTNASWTLKCDLTSEYVCRLLNHMDQHGYAQCTPRLNDPELTPEPAIDFTSGYVLRALHTLPRQGSKTPWRVHQKLREGPFYVSVRARGRRHNGVQGGAARAQRRCGSGSAWLSSCSRRASRRVCQ